MSKKIISSRIRFFFLIDNSGKILKRSVQAWGGGGGGVREFINCSPEIYLVKLNIIEISQILENQVFH